MCVIVDANVAGDVFATPCSADFQPLINWIESKDGKIVYGGKLATELYFSSERVKRRIMELNRRGTALYFSDSSLAAELQRLEQTKLCRSNDVHILALALATKVRLLCSRDKDLQADFKNPQILNDPRGHVYQNASHRHLLKHTKGCIGNPPK